MQYKKDVSEDRWGANWSDEDKNWSWRRDLGDLEDYFSQFDWYDNGESIKEQEWPEAINADNDIWSSPGFEQYDPTQPADYPEDYYGTTTNTGTRNLDSDDSFFFDDFSPEDDSWMNAMQVPMFGDDYDGPKLRPTGMYNVNDP